MSARKKKRPTIGLLIDELIGGYQHQMWPGIADLARERDVNLLCFSGKPLRSPLEFDSERNVIYGLASSQTIDGLIITSGTLGNYIPLHELEHFCQRYHPLPIVSIALPLEGIPSVLVNNDVGIREAVTHLVQDHGFRRIAFIRGPQAHQEAKVRYDAYARALAEHGIPLNPDLVAQGDFLAAAGAEAVRTLLDERRLDFDAIMAANDNMAIGAMRTLQARGIRVPEEVAIIGFDDIEEGRCSTPPLSTVQQPLREQGQTAATMLLDLLAGRQVEEQAELPTRLITRRSCGCFSQAVMQAAADTPVTLEPELVQTSEESRTQSDSSRSGPLLDAFAAAVENGSPQTFLATLDQIVGQAAAKGDSVTPFQDALSRLHRYALGALGDSDRLSQAERLLQQARVLVAEVAQRAHLAQKLRTRDWVVDFVRTGDPLMTTFDITELMSLTAHNLPQMGIEACYLSLYDRECEPPDDDPLQPPTKSRLILAYDRDGRRALDEGGVPFPTKQLVPQEVWGRRERYAMLVEPLFFQHDQLGFALFQVLRDYEKTPVSTYEILSQQISTAIKGAQLFEERDRLLADLASHTKALERTTGELARSNTELKQFASVASHDLQEPLRTVRSYLQLLQEHYGDKLDGEAAEFVWYAADGADRMLVLIKDLLTYSRAGLQVKTLTPVDCTSVLKLALRNLKAAIDESGAVITHDALPTVHGDATQLIQLFQNLIGNSVKFRSELPPQIHVGVEQQDEDWVFSVRDNGIGIEPQHFERIFDLFQRLHKRDEYRGTGIGLALCKKIVEGHGGRIWVESKPQQGTTLCFTIPGGRTDTLNKGPSSSTRGTDDAQEDSRIR